MPSSLGRYELVRPLASGGMATVYLGRVSGEGGFERLVAIKLMHPHIANEPEFVSMFLDEARVAARIRHPNVVPTLDVERSDEGLFLVMEYIEGHALHSVMRAVARANTQLPFPVTLRIVVDLLEGLHAAHELRDEAGEPLSLVHRDVSPQNVLIGADGVSRITDFGVAHARSRLATTQGVSLKGKVSYLSPEQVLSGQVDRRSDIFAAGIVLWELLTRRRLFRGDTEGQTIAQIIAGARKAPADYQSTLPDVVSVTCMKALALDPNQRFQTAVEFADAIEHAAKQAGIVLAKPREVSAFLESLDIPPPTAEPGRMPGSRSGASSHLSHSSASAAASMVTSTPAPARRRTPVVALALGGLALVGLGAGAILWLRSSGSAPAAPPSAARTGAVELAAPAPPSTTIARAPEPSASQVIEAKPAPSASASAGPGPRTTPERESRPANTKERPARPTATGYRPEGL